MEIRGRLKQLRKKQNITVKQAAQLLGFTQKEYKICEKNILQATATQIIKLSKFYNVSSDYILGFPNHQNEKQQTQNK